MAGSTEVRRKIEPDVLAVWKEMKKGYAKSQNRSLDTEKVEDALVWSEPDRTTAISRNRAKNLFEKGLALHCVWSGRKLTIDKFDIDHCFSFSAWPCDDLWNLMPSSRRVNQNGKRDKLPGLFAFNESRERIMEWWESCMCKGKRDQATVLQ